MGHIPGGGELADMPLDRGPLAVRQGLARQPTPAAPVEQIGMRASRDQVGLKDRMYFVLDPGSVPNHLSEGPVDVDANNPSHPCLSASDGGRHDNYGFALAAQPGGSQRRPATNTKSQLIV